VLEGLGICVSVWLATGEEENRVLLRFRQRDIDYLAKRQEGVVESLLGDLWIKTADEESCFLARGGGHAESLDSGGVLPCCLISRVRKGCDNARVLEVAATPNGKL